MTPTPDPNSLKAAIAAQDAFDAAHPEVAAALDAAWREARLAGYKADDAEGEARRARAAADAAWQAALALVRETKVDYGHPLMNAVVLAPNAAAAKALIAAAR
jgi:hypothetical protein